MPRPSKRVAPDTLGGRLRAARQNLRLSLSEVAGDRYSTSLISQIERNRVDPSADSLHYLANRLKLPLDDLLLLARQHRESETEANLYKNYEEKYAEINQLLNRNQAATALECFRELDPAKLPLFLRWRTLALRGQTYFEQRRFSAAQRDFQSALVILPVSIPEEYQIEITRLRLHLAASTRELNQFENALEYYQQALAAMDALIPLRYIAEAHWGLALVYYRKAQNAPSLIQGEMEGQERTRSLLTEAWKHAEDACTLYNSIADSLNAALLQCQMALIEQALGQEERARQRLLKILSDWMPMLEEHYQTPVGVRPYQPRERANVVSAAACYLADIESHAGRLDEALKDVRLAIETSEQSYMVRKAEAQMMLGQILEARDNSGAEAEAAFRRAVDLLKNTDRMVARTKAHYLLGRYLLSVGQKIEGRQQMETVRELAGIPWNFSVILPAEEKSSQGF